MRLIAELPVPSPDGARSIQLFQGDLTAVPTQYASDLLVVSAFQGNYRPTPGTLIRALYAKGLLVDDLALHKEVDLRKDFACWLSKEIEPPIEGIPFRRILGFEPEVRGRAPEVVGDIFRALEPFVHGPPHIRSVSLPLVATGSQGYSPKEILPPLLEASWHRLSLGHPLKTIRIVAHSDENTALAKTLFVPPRAKRDRNIWQWMFGRRGAARNVPRSARPDGSQYDVFVSYSRVDKQAAKCVAQALVQQGLRVFIDEAEIEVGSSWQQAIFDALEVCRATVVVYSPHFTQSKVCKDEFNIAMILRRRKGDHFIHPVLVRDVELPAYMELLNYDDCRVDDAQKLRVSAEKLASRLKQAQFA